MSRRARSVTVFVALFMSLAACGGSKTAVRSASTFIDDVMRGARPAEYQLADDAEGLATAAVRDGPALETFSQAASNNADWACFVLGLIDTYGEAQPDSTDIVLLSIGDQISIDDAAANEGIPADFTGNLTQTAQRISQSTLVGAAASACDIADSGL